MDSGSGSGVAAADNCIVLRGTLPAAAQPRSLANGTDVANFQVTVPRPEGTGARSDTIDCVCSSPDLQRRIAKLAEGDRVEVTGRLERRFWRGPAGVVSRYEVQVASLRRLRRREA